MLLPAGTSDFGQILHPEPTAVSSHHCPPTKRLCRISGRGRDPIQCKVAPDVLTELCGSRGLPCSAHPREGSLEPSPPSVDFCSVSFQTSQDAPGSSPGSVTHSTILCLLHRHHVPVWELAAAAGGPSEEVPAETC